MAFVAAPNIVEVQFRCTFQGSLTMNRIHVNVLHTPTSSDLATLVSELAGWWIDNVAPLVNVSLELREVYAKSLASQPGPEATFSEGLPVTGSLSGEALPANCSLAVSLRSNVTGRSSRGRWFWQGFEEGQSNGSLISSGILTSIDQALTNLRSDIIDLGFIWVIVSYRHDNAPRVGGPVYFNVLDITIIDNVVDSQRRRLPGRGR